VELQFRLNQESIDKAQIVNDARLESMNEFRSAMKDQIVNYVTRTELDYVNKEISELKRLIYIGLGIVITIVVLIKLVT
jgi:hypothetical protein